MKVVLVQELVRTPAGVYWLEVVGRISSISIYMAIRVVPMLSGTVYSFSIGFMRFNLMVAVVVEVSSFGVGIELVLVN